MEESQMSHRMAQLIGGLFILVVMVIGYNQPVAAQLPVESSQAKAERMAWWTDARFGMFIHWGTYALAARHEWVKNREEIPDEKYQKYFDRFNPDLYNPKEWAKAAKKAGMKYFVITAKHHEGFCLWDTRHTDYNATNTPAARDLLRPMVEAFRAEGLKVGFYYSLIDWHHPDFTIDSRHSMRNNKAMRATNKDRDMKKYQEYMKNQVRELLTEFGRIDCLFLDFSYPGEDGKGRDDWDSINLLKMIRELQPNVIVNDRLDLLDVPGGYDFRTPEQFLPLEWVTDDDGNRVPWETCQTFSGSWGYYRDETTWKSPRQLIVMLIECVSKGGNLLLNVGPTGRGTFDYRAIDRLNAMGDWMKVNGRSIYECTAAPDEFKTPDNCLLTYNPKNNRLYVHVLDWPMGGRQYSSLYLEGFADKVKYAQLLNDASEVQFTKPNRRQQHVKPNTLVLQIPVNKPPVNVPVIELYLEE
jgi:alpha-L-fucosidase